MATLHPDGHASRLRRTRSQAVRHRHPRRRPRQERRDRAVQATPRVRAVRGEEAIEQVTIRFARGTTSFLSRLIATPAARAEVGSTRAGNCGTARTSPATFGTFRASRPYGSLIPTSRVIGSRSSASRAGTMAPAGGALRRRPGHDLQSRVEPGWTPDPTRRTGGAAHQGDGTVAFLIGAGGIGKTRLLKAVADAAPAGTQIRILPGDAQVTAADFELFPHDGDLTVIIDDAHEIAEVTGIVAGIWRRNRNARSSSPPGPTGCGLSRKRWHATDCSRCRTPRCSLGDLEFDDADRAGA